MKGPAVDIRDLARYLNLSIGTVSRALNGRAYVSEQTRRRVLEAAAELSYVPNQSGRNLRKGTTHAIAFLLQPHPGDHQYGEPFFVPLLKGLQSELAARDLELIAVMDHPGGDLARLRRIVEARWADAIILAWTRRVDPRIEYLTEAGFPFATLGRSRSGGQTYPALDLDFVSAGEQAVDRLVGLGHTRIAVVGPATHLNFAHLYRQGYRRGLMRNDLPFDAELVANCEVNEAGGHAATTKLLSGHHPPGAILYLNDAVALGGCRALRDLGLRPGLDTAVIVTVASALCRYLSPALTGFSAELEPLGRRLAHMLLMSMPRYAGDEGPRILREVWPLTLRPGESDPPLKS
jgi:DNA-binding LacI/PurR family transcriptional regulator